jgi:hypothetical protein
LGPVGLEPDLELYRDVSGRIVPGGTGVAAWSGVVKQPESLEERR